MSRLTLPFLFAAALVAGCADPCRDVQVAPGASLDEAARVVLETCLAAEGAPGGAVALARGDEIGIAVAGPAQADGTALTKEHLLRVGSVTKTFTAALVLRLAKDGALSLDDAIEAYVPGLPNGSRITLEHLLRMTSGLANYTDLETVQKNWGRAWTPEELLGEVRKAGAEDEPGERYTYSNTNYFLLGLVIEQATGLTFDEAVRVHLLEGAGLSDSVMTEGAPRMEAGRLAAGMTLEKQPVAPGCHPSVTYSAGAVVSTPEGMLRFLRQLESGALLDAGELARMRATGPVQSFWSDDEYGMGTLKTLVEDVEIFGHSGGHPSGAVAWWMSEPKSGIRVFVQFNTHQVSPRGMADGAMSVMLRNFR